MEGQRERGSMHDCHNVSGGDGEKGREGVTRIHTLMLNTNKPLKATGTCMHTFKLSDLLFDLVSP